MYAPKAGTEKKHRQQQRHKNKGIAIITRMITIDDFFITTVLMSFNYKEELLKYQEKR